MNRIATLFRRGHAPDIDTLSAFVDGQLAADATRATDAHVDDCAVCSAEVEGMRRVKAMLAAMPELDAPRSFRLRPSDVAVPTRPTHGAASGAMRWAPALSGVAAALFLVVLGTDFATRDGGDERQASLAAQGDSAFRADGTSGDGFDYRAAESESADAPAAGGVEPPAGATGGEGDGRVVPATACDTDNPNALELDTCTAASPDSSVPQPNDPGKTPLAGGIAPDGDATKQAERIEALNADGDGDGNRTGFLVVEIIVGALAAGAIGTYIVSRMKRSEG